MSPPHYSLLVYKVAGLETRYTLPLLRPCQLRNACFSDRWLWQTKPFWATELMLFYSKPIKNETVLSRKLDGAESMFFNEIYWKRNDSEPRTTFFSFTELQVWERTTHFHSMQVSLPHYILFVYRIAGRGTRYTLPLLRPCHLRNACFSYGYLRQTKQFWAT